ncbi:MAG: PKD domain-containing protein, partial [Flavobacteriales bacterium]|nr:PKD domain-containing protein [Flavobacteriales bacterium]
MNLTVTCAAPPPPGSMINGTINACSGNFFDSGGNGSDYGNNQNLVYTICPSTPGARVQVNFSAFNIENGWDFLTIYNGPNTSSPTLGTYSGTNSPGMVQATPANPSGCLTFQFTSDGSVTAPGWAATISCIQPCQTITSNWVSSSPAPQGDGVIRICQGQTVNFVGSGTFSNSGTGATYTWNFGNGATATGTNVSYTFNQPGGYVVNLNITDPNGCQNANFINRVVQVSTTPVINTTANPNPICAGQSTTLNATVSPTPFVQNCTPPVSGTVFLPDGTGASYQSPISVNCYASSQTITSASQIQNICLNMEHSYLGDLNIALICPNGQSINLVDYVTMPDVNYILGNPVATGLPIDDNSGNTTPGTGLTYCFSPTATNGFIYNAANTTFLPVYTDPTGNVSFNVTQVNPGTYQANGNWNNLIGCPLNGNWTIQITDNLALDNGYIFSWDLNFAPSTLPANTSFTPTIVSQGWLPATGLTSINGTQATVSPTAPGNPCYTYSVTDNFGCTYTQQQCFTVNPGVIPTFAAVGPYCAGATIPALPTTSQNGITGTWSPAINNTATTTYTFTPTPGLCATTTTLTVNIINGIVSMTCPPGQSLQCSSGIPAPYASFAAFTAAGGSASATNSTLLPATFELFSQVSNNQTCPEVITRTYRIQDNCGNFATCQQVITINDNVAPTFAAPPADITVACIGSVPVMTSLTWTDNCDGTGSVTG